MKNAVRMNRVCPLCGMRYDEPPALSRTDSETLMVIVKKCVGESISVDQRTVRCNEGTSITLCQNEVIPTVVNIESNRLTKLS